MRSALILVSLLVGASCATTKSVIEIPPCADRVEIQGQAQRLSPTRFELDHTFDLMLSRTQLSLQANGAVNEFTIESTQPEPLRLFVGVGAVVIGGLLLGSASYDLARGQALLDERPFYTSLWGSGLLVVGTAAAITGWHPAQSYITFPGACPDAPGGVLER